MLFLFISVSVPLTFFRANHLTCSEKNYGMVYKMYRFQFYFKIPLYPIRRGILLKNCNTVDRKRKLHQLFIIPLLCKWQSQWIYYFQIVYALAQKDILDTVSKSHWKQLPVMNDWTPRVFCPALSYRTSQDNWHCTGIQLAFVPNMWLSGMFR